MTYARLTLAFATALMLATSVARAAGSEEANIGGTIVGGPSSSSFGGVSVAREKVFTVPSTSSGGGLFGGGAATHNCILVSGHRVCNH